MKEIGIMEVGGFKVGHASRSSEMAGIWCISLLWKDHPLGSGEAGRQTG